MKDGYSVYIDMSCHNTSPLHFYQKLSELIFAYKAGTCTVFTWLKVLVKKHSVGSQVAQKQLRTRLIDAGWRWTMKKILNRLSSLFTLSAGLHGQLGHTQIK